jgi:iron-sulfur cluster assembly protein
MGKVISELDRKAPIIFTSSAKKEIQRLLNFEDEGKVLFIGVKNGGCSGYSYVFEFIHPDEAHRVYQLEGMALAILPEDLSMIDNLEVDYEQGLNNRGFTFENPNADTTCGCGTSFA